MSQIYQRKTNRESDGNMLQCAMQLVLNEMSIRYPTQTLNVNHLTLKRYMDNQKDGAADVTRYKNCKRVNMIFPSHMKTELARRIKQLAASYHGLLKEKCLKLIFEYAVRNAIENPEKRRNSKN